MAKELKKQGPTMAADGLPPNPSDEIFMGRALPTVRSEATVVRRPFSEVTKNPLYFREGMGTDAPRISTGVGERE